MARIPDEEIERLKREIPIERLVKAAGIELRKYGADLIGRCPFHDDREPSLGRDAGEKSVALPGRLQHGRIGDRLGDQDARRQLPSRGRVAQSRSSFARRARSKGRSQEHNREARSRRLRSDAGDQESLARAWLASITRRSSNRPKRCGISNPAA